MNNIYYLDKYLLNIIASYLDYGEDGILNLLCKQIYNSSWKLNINGFILNEKMFEWFNNNFIYNNSYYINKNKCVKYKLNKNIIWAIDNNYYNYIKYLVIKYPTVTQNIFGMIYAVQTNNFKYIKLFTENNFRKSSWFFALATRNNNLKIVKYLHENNYPWSQCTFNEAIKHNKNNKIVKYLYDNNCPYDKHYLKYICKYPNSIPNEWIEITFLKKLFEYYE